MRLAAIVVVICIWAAPAYAYIDGGTASMLFQLLIAGVLGAAFALKTFWRRVREFLRFPRRKQSAVDE